MERHADGVVHTQSRFEGQGGISLHEDAWAPEAGQVRAVLVVMHGLKDYGARYEGLARRLVRRGFAVYAFDLRGHGHSAGERARIDRFEEYLDDLSLFVTRVRAREPGRPVFLLGHSMGAAIATLYVERDRPPLSGLVLSAGALTADVSGFTRGVTQLVGNVLPGVGVLDLPDRDFSRDPRVVAAMTADPLVDHHAIAARTVGELLHAQERLQEGASTLAVPLLLLHGEQDRITPPAGSRHLFEKAGSTDKRLQLYPGLVHDLLHEPESERVAADLEQWLELHLAPRASVP